ncbi:MAG: hypothetical protein WAL38_14280 [Solirubrobacteraceae bacterium]
MSVNLEHVVGRLDGRHHANATTSASICSSPREQEILALVAERWSNGALPEQVVITSAPSKRHITRSFGPSFGEPEHVSWRVQVACCFSLRGPVAPRQ